MIKGEQIRAARALIGMSQGDLCSAVGISRIALSGIENGNREARPKNLDALQAALEQAGVIFLDDGESLDGGPGVRLRE